MRRLRRTGQRGAALVLALLVMLVLSGLGLVAMKAATDSTMISGMHRLQVQAKSVSDSINQLGLMRSGRQASSYHAELQQRAQGVDGFSGDQGLSDPEGLMRRGGYITFTSDYSADSDDDEKDGLFGMAADEMRIQSGDGPMTADNFFDGTSFEGIESQPGTTTNYRYIIRDPTTGPRAEGFGDDFCFIRVTVGSESLISGQHYDSDDDAETRSKQARALGRNVSSAMIGPIECG